MKKSCYVESKIKYYDMKVNELRKLFELSENEEIVNIEMIGERMVVITKERIIDKRYIRKP